MDQIETTFTPQVTSSDMETTIITGQSFDFLNGLPQDILGLLVNTWLDGDSLMSLFRVLNHALFRKLTNQDTSLLTHMDMRLPLAQHGIIYRHLVDTIQRIHIQPMRITASSYAGTNNLKYIDIDTKDDLPIEGLIPFIHTHDRWFVWTIHKPFTRLKSLDLTRQLISFENNPHLDFYFPSLIHLRCFLNQSIRFPATLQTLSITLVKCNNLLRDLADELVQLEHLTSLHMVFTDDDYGDLHYLFQHLPSTLQVLDMRFTSRGSLIPICLLPSHESTLSIDGPSHLKQLSLMFGQISWSSPIALSLPSTLKSFKTNGYFQFTNTCKMDTLGLRQYQYINDRHTLNSLAIQTKELILHHVALSIFPQLFPEITLEPLAILGTSHSISLSTDGHQSLIIERNRNTAIGAVISESDDILQRVERIVLYRMMISSLYSGTVIWTGLGVTGSNVGIQGAIGLQGHVGFQGDVGVQGAVGSVGIAGNGHRTIVNPTRPSSYQQPIFPRYVKPNPRNKHY